jgi:DNA processing protein
MTPRVALALASLRGVGRRRLRQMVSAVGGGETDDVRGFGELVARDSRRLRFAMPDADSIARAWEEGLRLADTCRRRGWRVEVLGAAGYPQPLCRLPDPPALLFVQGGPLDLDPPRVAIIGTRDPTPWGQRMARDCALAAARAGAVVVAGLAWGVDTEAHAAVVARRGVTWATLPGSIDCIYPEANTLLARRMVEHGGGLLSEYLPGTRPQPSFFVERDRLQAALADAVVVIETGLTGGTMHTVRFARELGVPLHVTLPAEPDVDGSGVAVEPPDARRGTHQLHRDGAPTIDPPGLARLVESIRRGRQAGTPTRGEPPQGRLFP